MATRAQATAVRLRPRALARSDRGAIIPVSPRSYTRTPWKDLRPMSYFSRIDGRWSSGPGAATLPGSVATEGRQTGATIYMTGMRRIGAVLSILSVGVVVAGCATSTEWDTWKSHPAHFASGD